MKIKIKSNKMLGIKDVDLKILSELNDKDLLNACLTNQYANRICKDEHFWRDRFLKTFGQHEKNETKTWRNFYLAVTYYLSKYFDSSVLIAIKGGFKDVDIIKVLISKRRSNRLLPLWIYEAAEIGDKKLMDFFVNLGVKYEIGEALFSAAKGGNKEIVDYFLSKNKDMYYIEDAAKIAEKYKHINLARYLNKIYDDRFTDLANFALEQINLRN